eukprot:17711_4
MLPWLCQWQCETLRIGYIRPYLCRSQQKDVQWWRTCMVLLGSLAFFICRLLETCTFQFPEPGPPPWSRMGLGEIHHCRS